MPSPVANWKAERSETLKTLDGFLRGLGCLKESVKEEGKVSYERE